MKRGVLIIRHLDGLAWLQRKQDRKTFLYGEWENFLFNLIHAFITTHAVYQSKFVKECWDRSGWRKPKNYSIIYNSLALKGSKPSLIPIPINLKCGPTTCDWTLR